MSNIQEKNIQNSSSKVIFDDQKESNIRVKPLSIKKTEELEKTLGKAIITRLEKEFTALGYKIPEK